MCRAASLSNVHTPPQKFVNLSKWFLWTYMDIYSITYFCRLSFYDNIEGTTLRGEKKGNFQWKSQEAVLFWSLVGGQFSASRQEPNKRTTWESLWRKPLCTHCKSKQRTRMSFSTNSFKTPRKPVEPGLLWMSLSESVIWKVGILRFKWEFSACKLYYLSHWFLFRHFKACLSTQWLMPSWSNMT